MPPNLISVRFDGELITAREGQTVLEAARDHNRHIPTLCHLEGLQPAGACRVCMVELAGSQRMVPACTTPLLDGMSLRTNSPALTQYRRMIVELLLSERNHVCSVCVSNGSCELQSLAQALGIAHVRYKYSRPPLPVDMTHPRFVFDPNRCILCTRCIRACSDVEGAGVWEVAFRGVASQIVSDLSSSWGSAASCTACGKCVQVCPTGALVEKNRLSHDRYKSSQSITRLSRRRQGMSA
ncbi:MAG: bidirectional hydrogenase complex protein HoxU [Terracidiphilus sp.]